jgi:antitoxin PrlF
MTMVTVSDKGQVVIPVEIRRSLGIYPGCQLDFVLDGQVIRAQVKRAFAATSAKEGFGMLKAKPSEKSSSKRRLADFDVAVAMKAGKP